MEKDINAEARWNFPDIGSGRGSEVLSEAVRWRGKAIREAWIDPPLLSLSWVYVNSILEWLVYDEGRLVKLVYFLMRLSKTFAGVAQ